MNELHLTPDESACKERSDRGYPFQRAVERDGVSVL